MSAAAASVVFFGCGGGNERQDADEPSGKFPVEVQEVTFPTDQKLAEGSVMKVVVRNAGDKTIPVVAVTIKCDDSKNGQDGSFDRQISGTDVADKNRPNFVVDTIPGPGRPKGNEQLDPLERSSAYVDTYTLGALPPNQVADFEWHVTAVHTGPFRVCYRVAAGLDGKAVAVQQGGKPLFAEINGTVSNKAPQTRVADDGKTVVTEPDSGQ